MSCKKIESINKRSTTQNSSDVFKNEKADVQALALTIDNTIRVEIKNPRDWISADSNFLIKFGVSTTNCTQLTDQYESKIAESSELQFRLVPASFKVSDLKQLKLCFVQEDKTLHEILIQPTDENPFAADSSAPAIVNYGLRCAQEIAYIPELNCHDGEEIPITVQGKTPAAYPKGMTCDRPAMLDYQERAESQCVPYSRIMQIPFKDPDVIGSLICRRYKLRDKLDPLFDDVAIIIQRKSTGATCFFQMPEDTNKPQPGSRVPPPHEKSSPEGTPSASNFWLSPHEAQARQCHQCHDSDPFIHSPFLEGTKGVPSNPLGPYTIVGKEFAAWKSTYAISTKETNICTSCHRIGSGKSCNEFLKYSTGTLLVPGLSKDHYIYPNAHWMPPKEAHSSLAQWNEEFKSQVSSLTECCSDPTGDKCEFARITKNLGY